ncbi:Vacuolar protein-sorting-associated protein 25 [Coemansia guatemalensis]|uniref:Vacuolar protein-sorting-associated protein 25 n=1 Tax=Coemansia guatemalensis TaxID=2761395 RepID=A0A9W8LT09_9FUNG|nr:Vacuolar protein-sorting-associated protein 25 [Coemansia guatemalensis]
MAMTQSDKSVALRVHALVEFHGLDLPTLRRSLEVLQSQGKAQLFAGSSDDDMGVKFFA